MNVRWRVNILGLDMRWYFSIFKSFTAWKTGITNRCKNGQYVLFLDYDNVPLQWIIEELSYIQKTFRMGDLHIFKTSKGYHVVNTEKRSFNIIVDMMKSTSCDVNYINVPLRYGKRVWTLRVSDKKGKAKTRYIHTIKGVNRRETSTPHNMLLKRLYGVKTSERRGDGKKHFYKSTYPIV